MLEVSSQPQNDVLRAPLPRGAWGDGMPSCRVGQEGKAAKKASGGEWELQIRRVLDTKVQEGVGVRTEHCSR
jgi:hypothetical protein